MERMGFIDKINVWRECKISYSKLCKFRAKVDRERERTPKLMNAFMRYDKARNSLPFFTVSGCPANLPKKYIADIEIFDENS